MARYQVPQFLEVEDKIFGPLTLKQFLYVAAGAALFFISWTVLPRLLAILIGVPVLVFFIALAFLKINNRPLSFAIENALKFLLGNKLYLWRKKSGISVSEINAQADIAEETPYAPKTPTVPKLADSKLKDMSWGLDVKKDIEENNKNNLNNILKSDV
jgi:hypothetical protein